MRVTASLFIALLLLHACSKDETPKPPVSTNATMVAEIDGEVLSFQNPRVSLKTINGNPYIQEIKGEISTPTEVAHALAFSFIGNLTVDNSNQSYSLISCTYHRNDYDDGYICFSDSLKMTITSMASNLVSGYTSDFTVAGDSLKLKIRNVNFNLLPSEHLDL